MTLPDTLINGFHRLCDFEKVGLAVSGGRDSVAMMLIAAEARGQLSVFPEVVVYSVDHGMRAEAADECRKVAAWAHGCGFRHRILTWDGEKPTSNLQAGARAARYRLLADAAREDGVAAIVTAHHREDQAETFLLRLARGSGVRGLSAMSAETEKFETEKHGTGKHEIVLLRPLLDGGAS